MIRRTRHLAPSVLLLSHVAASCALALLGSIAGGLLAASAESPKAKHGNQPPIRIEVQDGHGVVVAYSGEDFRHSDGASAVLAFDRQYAPGDRIVVNGPSRMAVRVDDWIPECLVYLANSPQTTFSFDIPYGQGEPQTRSPFSRDSFTGEWHRVTARALTTQELSGYRNLAMNACDQELQPPGEEGTAGQRQAFVFPHDSTNSVSRSLTFGREMRLTV